MADAEKEPELSPPPPRPRNTMVPNVSKEPEAFREWIHVQLDKIFRKIAAKKDHQSDNTDLRYKHVAYVGVDGLIGVGKSTLCTQLQAAFAERFGGGKSKDQHICLQEHVNAVWLKAFYENPSGMATLFQNNQCQNCLRTIREALLHAKLAENFSRKLDDGTNSTSNDICGELPLHHSVVVDRTGFGNFSFAVLHVSLGNISLEHFDLYTEILAEAGEAMLIPYMIYLDAPLKTIHARIQKRAESNAVRQCEKGKSGVSLEYLSMLDVTMKAVFDYLEKKYPERTMRLNWSEFGDANQIMDTICKKIQQSADTLPQQQQN